MATSQRKIKDKTVAIDREIGEATVTITLYGMRFDELRTLLTTSDIMPIALEGGADIIGVIKKNTISNRYGEVTGTWIFKIPTIDPENSTSTILKRRERKKNQEKKPVVEEDWNIGPED